MIQVDNRMGGGRIVFFHWIMVCTCQESAEAMDTDWVTNGFVETWCTKKSGNVRTNQGILDTRVGRCQTCYKLQSSHPSWSGSGCQATEDISRLEVAEVSRSLSRIGSMSRVSWEKHCETSVPDSPDRRFVILTLRMDPKPGEWSMKKSVVFTCSRKKNMNVLRKSMTQHKMVLWNVWSPSFASMVLRWFWFHGFIFDLSTEVENRLYGFAVHEVILGTCFGWSDGSSGRETAYIIGFPTGPVVWSPQVMPVMENVTVGEKRQGSSQVSRLEVSYCKVPRFQGISFHSGQGRFQHSHIQSGSELQRFRGFVRLHSCHSFQVPGYLGFNLAGDKESKLLRWWW